MKRLEISKKAHLIGHHHPVYTIAMAADGNRFYTAGNDKGVVQWSLAQPGFERVLCPVPHTVYALQVLPEGAGLLLSMRSGAVWLVNTQNGQIIRRFELHQQPVFAFGTRLGAGGQKELIIGSEDGWVSVWNLDQALNLDHALAKEGKEEGQPDPIFHFKLADAGIRCMAISPDGKWLGFGTKDGKITVLDAGDLSVFQVLNAHEQGVISLSFSPDNRYLMSSGRDARFCVFNTSDFALEKEFVPHMYAIYSMQFHPNLPIFATASRDKSVKIWSSEDYRLLRSISLDKGMEGHRLSVNGLTWDHSGRFLLTTGDDKTVMIWELDHLNDAGE